MFQRQAFAGAMTRAKTRAISLVVVALTASCGSDAIETPASDAGVLSVINASAASVDIRVDGTLRFSSVSPSTVTTALALSPGTHTVQLASSGATVSSQTVTIDVPRGVRRGVVVTPAASGGLAAASLPDTGLSVNAGRSKLRVLHYASAAPPLTIWRTQPDYQTPISIMFPYAYMSGATMESAAGTWEVRVWPTSSGSWSAAASAVVVPVSSGQLRTVVTLDAPGGGVKLQLLDL